MRKIANFIVKHSLAIFVTMAILAAAALGFSTNVNINHDIKKYMPDSSETAQAIEIMNAEFGEVDTTNYSVMLEDASAEQIKDFSDFLESVADIDSVAHDDSEKYNKTIDNATYTLFTIKVKGEADGEAAAKVYGEVSDFLKEKSYTYYENGDIMSANGAVVSPIVLILAVSAATIVITILSKSWVEPWLYLFSIGVAIALNMGTNLLFPSVSHVTNAISAVLQLALSMDYSIMLAERYRQERAKKNDKKKAMAAALTTSFSAISASSITTFVGLLALIFMSFTIGRDMGLVLAKGVLLSLVSIFTILPALLLLFDKWVISSHKKALNLKMTKLSEFAYAARRFAIPVFAIILVVSFILKGNVPINFTSEENNRIKEVFAEENQVVVIYNNQDEEKIIPLCRAYESKTSQAICYSNTINDPQKVDKIVPKAKELGYDITIEDHLLRVLYYHYHNLDETHRMSLTTFLNFIQNDLAKDANFSGDISKETLLSVGQLSYFVTNMMNDTGSYDHKEMYQKLSGIAAATGQTVNIDSTLVDLIYIYHGSVTEFDSSWSLSLDGFIKFINDKVLPDSRFDRKISDEKRRQATKAAADLADVKKMLIGSQHSRMLLNTNLELEGPETFNFLAELKQDLNDSGIENLVAGNSYMAYEMSQSFDDEMNLVTIITMVAIFIVVAITFRSFLIPAILVLIIQSAVWVTMSVLSSTGSELYFIAEIIVQAILMGATIDYAILFTSYYRDAKGDIKKALAEAYRGSISTILTSAAVLILVTFLVGNFGGATAIASKICITVSEGSLAATILVIFILPSVLAGFGKLARRTGNKS